MYKYPIWIAATIYTNSHFLEYYWMLPIFEATLAQTKSEFYLLLDQDKLWNLYGIGMFLRFGI